MAGQDISINDLATSDLATDVSHTYSNDMQADDHCAHGAAHLVGIFYDAKLPLVAVSPNLYVSSIAPLVSLYISPLLRPPIV